MNLAVIGAGLGRTGTHSLKLALEMLGFGPCYHMAEVFEHPGHAEIWHALTDGTSHDFDAVLSGYRSAVDLPVAYFWRELAAANPNAKIILTERGEDVWFDSVKNTIFERLSVDPETARFPAQLSMARHLVVEKLFGNDLSRENVIAVYRRHNAEVKRTIAPERLLVFEGSQGWQPLCEFLGVAVPEQPYPITNTTKEFQARATQGGRYKA
jgi:hypothetical protein